MFDSDKVVSRHIGGRTRSELCLEMLLGEFDKLAHEWSCFSRIDYFLNVECLSSLEMETRGLPVSPQSLAASILDYLTQQ